MCDAYLVSFQLVQNVFHEWRFGAITNDDGQTASRLARLVPQGICNYFKLPIAERKPGIQVHANCRDSGGGQPLIRQWLVDSDVAEMMLGSPVIATRGRDRAAGNHPAKDETGNRLESDHRLAGRMSAALQSGPD